MAEVLCENINELSVKSYISDGDLLRIFQKVKIVWDKARFFFADNLNTQCGLENSFVKLRR